MKNTTKLTTGEKKLFSIIVFCCILIVVIIFLNLSISIYVRGVYGEYCYKNSDKPNSIIHPLYFNNLTDCLKSFK